MVSHCCITLLKERIEKIGLKVENIKLGEITVHINSINDKKKLEKTISRTGFEIIQSRDKQIVEQIKIAVIELVHQLNNTNSIIRKSDYLVEKLGMSYQQISKTFSQHESITLEKYIILQKIEKIKELIDSDEYSLSEIAYMMDYSSVQHLSAQFKNTTGLTPSEYRKSDRTVRKALENLY